MPKWVYKFPISRYNNSMIIYTTFALLLGLTIPSLAHVLLTLTKGRRWGLNLADVSLPFYGIALFLVSKAYFTNSFLPHYLAAMSLTAIITCSVLLKKQPNFSLRRFTKIFWRIGFFVTLLAYLLTLIAILTAAG